MSDKVIIDGRNTLKERKLLIRTDNYSIGEDGQIDRTIPFTDICYDLALQLQRLKAENERLRQYKRSKQASYEAMQAERNRVINENREIKNFFEKAIAERNSYKESVEHLKKQLCVKSSEYCEDEFGCVEMCKLRKENAILKLITEPQREEIQKYRDKAIQFKQALEEVREIAKLIKEDDDKPACVYDEGCPLNGGAGFDNHCNMTCPYILAKIIDDKINEVLK